MVLIVYSMVARQSYGVSIYPIHWSRSAVLRLLRGSVDAMFEREALNISIDVSNNAPLSATDPDMIRPTNLESVVSLRHSSVSQLCSTMSSEMWSRFFLV